MHSQPRDASNLALPLVCRYEKARKLKDSIADIRAEYTRHWDARDRRERQVRSGGGGLGF